MQDEIQKAIAAELGISELPNEQQQELISKFGEIALKAATLAVVKMLPEDKREEFGRLAEAGDTGALKSFLDANVPEHEAIARTAVQDEIKRFKEFQASPA